MPSEYLIELIDGPCQGKYLIPELKIYWYFKTKDGNWTYYRLFARRNFKSTNKDNEDKKPALSRMAQNFNPNSRAKKKILSGLKNQPLADYSYCIPFGEKPESHCDVQTFFTWHRLVYGRDPENCRA